MEYVFFCEWDICKLELLEIYDEQGEFLFYIKKQDQVYLYIYFNYSFDFVGWDGYVYFYVFSIYNFEFIIGWVYQLLFVYQIFVVCNFVICFFVFWLYDYYLLAIFVFYNYSNIDSDEVFYYVDGDFMSCKYVEKGMIIFYFGGILYGLYLGIVEKSIGKQGIYELVVMVDIFKLLQLIEYVVGIEDWDYYKSWLLEEVKSQQVGY